MSLVAEIWKDVRGLNPEFSKRYQVSNFGNVRCHPDAKAKGCKPSELRTLSLNDSGYWAVLLCAGRSRLHTTAHRLVALAFIGDAPSSGHQVNHIDGDRQNNHLSNLEWVTPVENSRHSIVRRGVRRLIDVGGESLTLTAAVEKHSPPGLTANSVEQRIKKLGWDPMRALFTPPMKSGRPPSVVKNSKELP